jgi:hypothetical protein
VPDPGLALVEDDGANGSGQMRLIIAAQHIVVIADAVGMHRATGQQQAGAFQPPVATTTSRAVTENGAPAASRRKYRPRVVHRRPD